MAQGRVRNGNEIPAKRRGISGSTLKWIAILTMLIDHIGAAVISRVYTIGYYAADLSGGADLEHLRVLYQVYRLSRDIGRIAFPIFCFLLVEGFLHTSSVKKYMLRLGVFALLSEIPFDLAFAERITLSQQNVFFTLLIALATIAVMDRIEESVLSEEGHLRQDSGFWRTAAAVAGIMLALGAGMLVAEWLSTDYGAKGILAICVFYLFRKIKPLQLLCGCLSFVYFEKAAVLAFLPLALYNGTRGKQMKYFFYLFYPLHLLLLYLFCVVMKLL